jgi:hypothetical protein
MMSISEVKFYYSSRLLGLLLYSHFSFFGLVGWKRKQDKLSGNQQLLRLQSEKVARKDLKRQNFRPEY